MARRPTPLPEVIYRRHAPQRTAGELASDSPHPAQLIPLYLFLMAVSLGLIALDVRYQLDWAQQAQQWAITPILQVSQKLITPVRETRQSIRTTLAARAENEELKVRVAELERQLQTQELALTENKRLLALLDLKADVAPEAEAARVMNYRDTAESKTLILMGGEAAGQMEGQPVLGSQGQLLGLIDEVLPLYAVVRLLHDPKMSVGITLEKNQAHGVLYNFFDSATGCRNLYVRLDRNEPAAPGDLLVTSRLSSLFPRGLIVGRVGEPVSNEVKDLFVAVELELMRDYKVEPVLPLEKWSELTEVLCLPISQR